MNNSYEKIKLIYSFIFIFFVIFLLSLFVLFNKKIYQYKCFSSVVVKDDLIVLMVDVLELDLFYSNSFIFIDNEKVKFSISKINSDMLEKDGVLYSEVYLKVKFDNYKENDVIEFSILEKKINSFEIFKVIWR